MSPVMTYRIVGKKDWVFNLEI